MSRVVAVIPSVAGREANLTRVCEVMEGQSERINYFVIGDGNDAPVTTGPNGAGVAHHTKHVPGLEQPRNIGARYARHIWSDMEFAWFVDSDILFKADAHRNLLQALAQGQPRILVGPYDWGAPGVTHYVERGTGPPFIGQDDMRWPMFDASPPSRVYEKDLSAGLACFGGNLAWPVEDFERVGGFWNELHMGRCEDGELGLRAVAMGVPISLMPEVRGFHIWHPVNMDRALAANARDVPMLDARHPWVQQAGVELNVDRDGGAFDVVCGNCGQTIHTIQWWRHCVGCGLAPDLLVNP